MNLNETQYHEGTPIDGYGPGFFRAVRPPQDQGAARLNREGQVSQHRHPAPPDGQIAGDQRHVGSSAAPMRRPSPTRTL